MFRALLAHPQEGCTNGTWYIACVLCQLVAFRIGVEVEWNAVCGAPPADEQVMLETCRGP
jgi:hypothetical protein